MCVRGNVNPKGGHLKSKGGQCPLPPARDVHTAYLLFRKKFPNNVRIPTPALLSEIMVLSLNFSVCSNQSCNWRIHVHVHTYICLYVLTSCPLTV